MSPLPILAPDPELTFAGGGLRLWRPEDASRLVQAWQDEAIAAANAVPADPTHETALDWIRGDAHRRERRLALDLVLVEQPDGPVIGEVGFSGFSSDHGGAFIGYWLLPEARGRGLASKAVTAVTQWAFETSLLHMCGAKCHESNRASQRVVKRAGYIYVQNDGSNYQLWRCQPREA